MSYRLSPEAEDDLLEIASYIAARDPAAARKVMAEIYKACELLGSMPGMGHRRKDLTSDTDVLFYCVRDCYLVIYRKGTDPLQIARVIHGARDVEGELGDD